MEAERLEQFGAVLGMVVIIGLSGRPVREIHIVLCGLPEIMALLDGVGQSYPIVSWKEKRDSVEYIYGWSRIVLYSS